MTDSDLRPGGGKRRRFPAVGEINQIVSVIGNRGFGKSTWMAQHNADLYRLYGGYRVGHSPVAGIPDSVPNPQTGRRRKLFNRQHHAIGKDFSAFDHAVRSNPDTFHVVTDGATPEALLEYARALAMASVQSHGPRRPPHEPSHGVEAPPVHVSIDEGAAMKSARRGKSASSKITDQDDLMNFLVRVRHEHMTLTWNIQSAGLKSYHLVEQSTHLVVFRSENLWAFQTLAAQGVPQETLEEIRELPKYHALVFTTGEMRRYRKIGPENPSILL